ncbi:MAG: LuxR C-terminal-related transcriptional regulator [Flavobacteriaceae bacterium]|nr:hypothetical protein [Flavobacteriaceae bacterium]
MQKLNSIAPFTIKFYHFILVMVSIILIAYVYVFITRESLDVDVLEKIRESLPNNVYQIEKNRMQVLFMKERGWNFIVFSGLVLSISIWMVMVNQKRNTLSFLGYKYRLQEKFSILEKGTFSYQDRLKKRFHSLTPNDLLVAELLAEGYSTKAISSELNISSSSANTARYRLRKKMKLPAETDLVDFLRQI